MQTFKCPCCGVKYQNKNAMYTHMEEKHSQELQELSPARYYFNIRNKKDKGSCIICKRETQFNEITERYERLCGREDCTEKYHEMFKSRMQKSHGVNHLLDSPDQQKKMLENRKISGVYVWQSGHKTKYTGSYEERFLEFMEHVMSWDNPADIIMPAPQVFTYKDVEGKERFYIPDVYITSMNLIVEIKASRANNSHYYRERDYAKEEIKDEILKKSDYNYIKVEDNNFKEMFELVMDVADHPEKFKDVPTLDKEMKKVEAINKSLSESYDLFESMENELQMILESNDNIIEELRKDANRDVYIILTDTKTFLGEQIKRVTKTPYGHASISLDPTLNEMYSFNIKKKGFVKESIKDYNQNGRLAVYRVKVTDQEYEAIENSINEFSSNSTKYRFNTEGFIGFLIKRPVKVSNDAYFCSEFVTEVVKSAGIELFTDRPSSLVNPYYLSKSKKTQFLYRGSIKNLKDDTVAKALSRKN